MFFLSALMLFMCFTGCKKDINEPTVLTCDEEYSFLLANPISSLPESLDEASWICFISKNRNKAETIESNLDYFFFAYVNTDMTFQYYAYLNSTEPGKNEQTSSITGLKSQIDYEDCSKIDMFSLGVVLFNLAFEKFPYELDYSYRRNFALILDKKIKNNEQK